MGVQRQRKQKPDLSCNPLRPNRLSRSVRWHKRCGTIKPLCSRQLFPPLLRCCFARMRSLTDGLAPRSSAPYTYTHRDGAAAHKAGTTDIGRVGCHGCSGCEARGCHTGTLSKTTPTHPCCTCARLAATPVLECVCVNAFARLVRSPRACCHSAPQQVDMMENELVQKAIEAVMIEAARLLFLLPALLGGACALWWLRRTITLPLRLHTRVLRQLSTSCKARLSARQTGSQPDRH